VDTFLHVSLPKFATCFRNANFYEHFSLMLSCTEVSQNMSPSLRGENTNSINPSGFPVGALAIWHKHQNRPGCVSGLRQMRTTGIRNVWVRKRTIPTERPPLVGEVSANFSG
jgi:hypothetical protein